MKHVVENQGLDYSLAELTKQKWAAITPGEFCLQIYCEDDHKHPTNPPTQIVITITLKRQSWRIFTLCIFFTHHICDEDHFNFSPTPYIYVIEITQNFAVWTVERFSARFHSIRTGLGYLCRRTLTINLGPQA